METNRLIFTTIDDSFVVTPGVSTLKSGLTVIKAPKGTAEPVLFTQGSENQIRARIGAPTKDYPGIAEAIEYNRSYDLWISAPPGVSAVNVGETAHNVYGGVYITTESSVEEFYAVTDPETPNFEIEVLGAGTSSRTSGQTLTLTPGAPGEPGAILLEGVSTDYTLATSFGYTNLRVVIAGTSYALAYNPATNGNILYGADTVGVYTAAVEGVSDASFSIVGGPSNALTTALESITAGLTPNTSLYYNITIPESEVIMTLYQNSPRADVTTIAITSIDNRETITDDDNNAGVVNPMHNTLSFTVSELPYVGGTTYTSKEYTVSTDPLKRDGFNASLYLNDVFVNNLYVSGTVYNQISDIATPVANPETGNGVVGSYSVSGDRKLLSSLFVDSDDLASTLAEGWDLVAGSAYSEVSVFFEPEAVPELRSSLVAKRTASYPFSTFVQAIKEPSTDTADATASLLAETLVRDAGINYCCNEFKMKDSRGAFYWNTTTGSVALMYTAIMDYMNGGVAPMFTNAQYNGAALGGQLNRGGVYKQKYNFTPDNLDALDAKGINPIILDYNYGLMLTSQKTGKSTASLTDWSYIGHQMAFDLFRKEVRNDVMIPQLGKPISAQYMAMRRAQTQTILNRRLTGGQAIWSDGAVYVEEVNTAETLAANKFVIKVRVKVTPFSEYVELIFNNVDQASSV